MSTFIVIAAAALSVILIAVTAAVFVPDGDGSHRKPSAARDRAARIRRRLARSLADDDNDEPPAVPGPPDPFAEPRDEDTITWLRRVGDEHEPPDGAAVIHTTRVGGVHLPLSGQPMVPARASYRVPCADVTAIDALPRDWLNELIEDGLGGFASVDDWVRARMRQLAITP